MVVSSLEMQRKLIQETNKDLKNVLSNSCLKKSILKKVDQKTKIHIEKFRELNQVLDEKEKNISFENISIS